MQKDFGLQKSSHRNAENQVLQMQKGFGLQKVFGGEETKSGSTSQSTMLDAEKFLGCRKILGCRKVLVGGKSGSTSKCRKSSTLATDLFLAAERFWQGEIQMKTEKNLLFREAQIHIQKSKSTPRSRQTKHHKNGPVTFLDAEMFWSVERFSREKQSWDWHFFPLFFVVVVFVFFLVSESSIW